MHIRTRTRRVAKPAYPCAAGDTAAAYNHAKDDYLAYADGDPNRLFGFDGVFGFGDRCTWSIIDQYLRARRAAGADGIRVLDAGCGPGTWLRRIVVRARELGYAKIVARGFDISEAQIELARQLAAGIDGPDVKLSFDVGDLTHPLAECDGSVDLGLCLYTVLNHLPPDCLAGVIAEFGRVIAGRFVTTVRALGSTPTIYVGTIEHARRFKQDHRADRLDIELQNGRQLSVRSHLFRANELQELVARHFEIEDLRGLDLFHSRFAADSRWNPEWWQAGDRIATVLERLEETYSRDSDFIDRASHLLLVARSRTTAGRG